MELAVNSDPEAVNLVYPKGKWQIKGSFTYSDCESNDLRYRQIMCYKAIFAIVIAMT